MLQVHAEKRADRALVVSKNLASKKIRKAVGAVCEAIEPRTYLTVSFSSPSATVVTGAHGPIVATQFTASGHNDLAVGTSTAVKILLGNSVGTFDAGGTINFPANSAAQSPFLVGNFKGTGSDIVLLSQNSTTHAGAVLYEASQANGTFLATLTSNITNDGGGFLPIAGTVGDFNGDGNDDLAIVGKPTSGTTLLLAILTSNDDGSFTEAHDYPVTSSAVAGTLSSISVAAKNLGQGSTDVVVNDSSSAHIDVFSNAGGATFTQMPPIALNASLMISDTLTSSNVPDLIVANGTQITVLLGVGDGTFSEQAPITAGSAITSLSSAEMDLDGVADLITNLGVLSGNGDGTFAAPVALPIAEGGSAFSNNIIAVDVDGDSRQDIVGISSAGNALLTAKNISMAASGTEITANLNPANPGDDVQFTATVSSALNLNATGQVDFLDNGVSIGTTQLQDDGTAIFDAGAGLAVGSHSITASYEGDADFAPSTSLPFLETILAPTTTVLVSSKNPSNVGDDVTITATVSGNDNGGDIPSGNVEFFDGGTDLGGAVLDANGNATLDSSAFAGGVHSITAQYDADTHFQGSTSAALAQTIASSALVPVVQTSTLPKSVISGATVHGLAVVYVTNTTAATISGALSVSVLASVTGGVVGATSLARVSVPKASIKPGNTLIVKVPIKSLPSSLTDGAYTLLAQVSDVAGSVSAATTGPTIQLASPFVSLSETFPAVKFPAVIVSGTKTKASIKVLVTNHGNVASKGPTIFSLSASSVQDQVGVGLLDLTRTVNIPPNATRSINIPIKSLPALADGNYFFVVQVTDPKGGVSIASPETTATIAAPFLVLAASIGPVKNINAGATVTIPNNGNIEDVTSLSASIGFSTDSAGAQPAPGTTVVVSPVIHIKPGKSVKLHMNQWKTILGGLTTGVPYFLTVSLTDASDNTAFGVSSTSFTL